MCEIKPEDLAEKIPSGGSRSVVSASAMPLRRVERRDGQVAVPPDGEKDWPRSAFPQFTHTIQTSHLFCSVSLHR